MPETKGSKADILGFIHAAGIVTAHHLVENFNLSLSYSRKRLTMLKKQGLVGDSKSNPWYSRGSWFLTEKGEARGRYFHEQGTCSKDWCCHCIQTTRSGKKDKSTEEHKSFYKQGYEHAEINFKITYSCYVCGREVNVDTSEEKEAVKRYLEHEGWIHAQCIGKAKGGRKASIKTIRDRIRQLTAEIKVNLAGIKIAPKYGIRFDQIDQSELNTKFDERNKLLLILPANEQIEFIKKGFS